MIMTLSERAAAYLRERLSGRSFRNIAEEHDTTPDEVRCLSRCARFGLPCEIHCSPGNPWGGVALCGYQLPIDGRRVIYKLADWPTTDPTGRCEECDAIVRKRFPKTGGASENLDSDAP
jgi:hypothetical protein